MYYGFQFSGSICEGRWEIIGRSRGRENCNQNIQFKIFIFNKEENIYLYMYIESIYVHVFTDSGITENSKIQMNGIAQQ